MTAATVHLRVSDADVERIGCAPGPEPIVTVHALGNSVALDARTVRRMAAVLDAEREENAGRRAKRTRVDGDERLDGSGL